ncbi:MAG: sulfatase [Rubrobacteraceae bacterium]
MNRDEHEGGSLEERTFTRRSFLKAAGAGAAGMSLLGAAGCSTVTGSNLPDEYLPTGGPRMNVVLVIIDSLRKDHVGALGNDWIRTPNLDALARDSLAFTRAYPESLPTVCARRAIHTGIRTFPFRNWNPVPSDLVHLYGWQPIPEDQTTLAEILEKEGYQTMLVTDTVHQFKPSYNFHRGFGLFEFIRGQERDFYKPEWLVSEERMRQVLTGGSNEVHMQDIARQYLANATGRRSKEEDWYSPQVFSKATEYLEGAARGGQPFFLMVDNYDPHEPWDPPEEYVSLYDEGYEGPEPMTGPNGDVGWMTERQIKRQRALYAAELTLADRWLGRFTDKMSELNLFDNTLVMVAADHGYILGEHGIVGKLPSAMYPELMEVPIFIRHPGGKGAGTTSEYHASTHDVAPTILSLLGIEQPEAMNGEDLSPILGGGEPATPRPYFTAGYHDHVWARDDRYAMWSRNDGGDAKLFDLQEDPEQENNIAGSNPDIVKRMFQDYVIEDAGGPLPRY